MTSQMARSADPKCIWASVSNTIKADAEIPDNNRKARAMVRICKEAYPSATPMPVPEIWKIGPAFPGVPRLAVPADFWLTRPAMGLVIRIICDAAAELSRVPAGVFGLRGTPEGQPS